MWHKPCRRLKSVSGLSATAATGRRSVANQSATCRQPVGNHQRPFYDRFGRRKVSLAATKTSLRPNRPCNRLQPVGDQSPTSLQTPCNLSATTWNLGRKEVADRLQAMCDRGLRPHIKSPYLLAVCMIVAFKYESHVTGHQIYDRIITYNTKLKGLCKV